MDMSDCICKYYKYLKTERLPEADIRWSKCTKFNKAFDQFHDPCDKCPHDTSKD